MLGLPLGDAQSAARRWGRLGAARNPCRGAAWKVEIPQALGTGKGGKETNVSSTPARPWQKNLALMRWEHAHVGPRRCAVSVSTPAPWLSSPGQPCCLLKLERTVERS